MEALVKYADAICKKIKSDIPNKLPVWKGKRIILYNRYINEKL